MPIPVPTWTSRRSRTYGNVTSGDTSRTRYLFTGREWDAAVDLQYNRARWYDAEVGRWLSEDPLGFVAGDANLQRYVGNAVVNSLDPSGLQDRYPPGTPGIVRLPGTIDFGIMPPGTRRLLQPRLPARAAVLRDIPILSRDTLPEGPKSWPTHGVSAHEYWVGNIPGGTLAGVSGCGPCVGVILIPTDSDHPIYAFHFDPLDSITGGLREGGAIRQELILSTAGIAPVYEDVALNGYSAVLCGGENREGALNLQDVRDVLEDVGYPIIGYVPASSMHVDPAGALYYTPRVFGPHAAVATMLGKINITDNTQRRPTEFAYSLSPGPCLQSQNGNQLCIAGVSG